MTLNRLAISTAVLMTSCVPAATVSRSDAVVTSQPLPRTILARGEFLAETKRLAREGNVYVLPAYTALLGAADSALSAGPFSVMQKGRIPPSGDKHDYMSLAPYWWPDTTKSDGLPYVRRDGVVNPRSRADHDGLRFLALTNAVEALGLAYYMTADQRYAERAAFLLRTWFIDPAKRMNPNLRYAQAIPGVSEGRGIGIIDLRHMPRLLDAVRLVEASPAWTSADQAGMTSWARAYLAWLRESDQGRQEQRELNNHGTLYDAQALALALFVGDSAFARAVAATSTPARIAEHFGPDGSQPRELERTRPLHYSLFNLDGFTQLAEMGRHVGVDLWRYRTPSGAGIVPALRHIAPYTDTTRKLPIRDVSPVAPDVGSIAMRRVAAHVADTIFERAADRGARNFGSPRRELIFYPGVRARALGDLDTLVARALVHSQARLKTSAKTLDPSNGFPRVTRKDGSWEQRPFNQWTSGFFAGQLWYMYQLTRDTAWRSLAQKWTAGLEPAKSIRTTHDLGFLIFDSFGHGHELTGDDRYRRVVIEASTSLASRFDPRVGAIKSWDTWGGSDRRGTWKYPVIVDNLMNLDMLFQAAQWNEPAWHRIAERHALTSAAAHLREDGSTPHVALFDPLTGQLERAVTWQGYSDNSTWARGQAWAIHGFTTAYRRTKRGELLTAARRAADYFIRYLPPDAVPHWDLLHPDIPRVERDASAGAIAASALLDLSRQVSRSDSARYRVAAERTLAALAADYLTEGTSSAAILLHSVGQRPQNAEIDVGIVYADYYFIEALLRLRGIWRP